LTYFVEVNGDARGPFGLSAESALFRAHRLRERYRSIPGVMVCLSEGEGPDPLIAWENRGGCGWVKTPVPVDGFPKDLAKAMRDWDARPKPSRETYPRCACGRRALRWRGDEAMCGSCYHLSLPGVQ
jgi:hypothetical protein